eukprot:Clim_evm17s55 gene=Clim_evmTU17s55
MSLERIILVRHGESEGNVDPDVYKRKADHSIELSERGHRQAEDVGKFLKKFFEDTFGTEKPLIRLWNSPYVRTRQTAQHIQSQCQDWIYDRTEHINFVEQQFGLFDGCRTDEERKAIHPHSFERFRRCIDHDGLFWAKFPEGESRFDVAVRVHQAFGSIHRDAECRPYRDGIKNIVVVAHGVTIRAFVMQWLHRSPEWFNTTVNPKNCSVWLLERNKDQGYIWAGEDHAPTNSSNDTLAGPKK